MNLELIKKTGVAAAYKSAKIVKSCFGNIDHVKKKGDIDLVTKADLGSEEIIIKTIRRQFPTHTILSEESGMHKGDHDCKWIIDPLDGTTNFAHNLSLFSISIAFAFKNKVVAGIVLNPETGELFTAIKNRGATLNSRAINVSSSLHVSESLLVTGFPYDFKKILEPLMMRFTNCLKASRGVRRLGSAALDLCYVACGRFDGFWEQNLNAWDTAAGALIAREAGAVITDFSDSSFDIDKKEILATNGKIHDEMLSLLKIEYAVGRP